MKKKLCLLLICICLIITGCNPKTKEAKNTNNFATISSNNGFIVNDNMNSYKNINYIKDSKKAIFEDITIEMVIYDISDNAKKAQENQIKNFQSLKSTGAAQEKDKGKNYYKYSLISNGYYMVSSRIDNTLIFAKVTLNNKEKIENILNSLEY